MTDIAAPAPPVAADSGRAPVVLGVDVGGTKTAGLLADAHDTVLARVQSPALDVPIRPGGLGRAVVALARAALDEAGLGRDALAAVGIGLPGHVDVAAGTVGLAVNLTGLDEPIASDVAVALGVPCFIEHDARSAARWLAAEDAGDHRGLAYVSIGTGISAGIVVDGRVVSGAAGMAGEIGHVVADPDGPRCVCGLDGCLEAVASGPAIARAARASARTGGSLLREDPTTADVFAAAGRGDRIAVAIVEVAAAHLARAIRGLVLSFGLDLVVVGGGVSRAGDALMEPLLAAVARERAASPVVRAVLGDEVIRRRPADPEAGTWGAVTVARAGLRDAERDREEVERRDVATQSR
jgi:predicted NBD/HSP70 family sugar kinase